MCQIQTHLFHMDVLAPGSTVLFLHECSSKHIPVSVLCRNTHLGIAEYIEVFYKDTGHF